MPPILMDVVRLTVWLVILALIFAPLERLFMLRRPEARRSILPDLGYFYLNGLVPTFFMAVPLAFLAGVVRAATPAPRGARSRSLAHPSERRSMGAARRRPYHRRRTTPRHCCRKRLRRRRRIVHAGNIR